MPQYNKELSCPTCELCSHLETLGLGTRKAYVFPKCGVLHLLLLDSDFFFFFDGIGKRIEREEEEEEEALPLDMMDEDDLQLMRDLGQRASFLTRDLSSR